MCLTLPDLRSEHLFVTPISEPLTSLVTERDEDRPGIGGSLTDWPLKVGLRDNSSSISTISVSFTLTRVSVISLTVMRIFSINSPTLSLIFSSLSSLSLRSAPIYDSFSDSLTLVETGIFRLAHDFSPGLFLSSLSYAGTSLPSDLVVGSTDLYEMIILTLGIRWKDNVTQQRVPQLASSSSVPVKGSSNDDVDICKAPLLRVLTPTSSTTDEGTIAISVTIFGFAVARTPSSTVSSINLLGALSEPLPVRRFTKLDRSSAMSSGEGRLENLTGLSDGTSGVSSIAVSLLCTVVPVSV